MIGSWGWTCRWNRPACAWSMMPAQWSMRGRSGRTQPRSHVRCRGMRWTRSASAAAQAAGCAGNCGRRASRSSTWRRATRIGRCRCGSTDRSQRRAGPAELMRVGWFKPAHAKSLEAHHARSLLLARNRLIDTRRNLQNQIRNIVKTSGAMPDSTRTPSQVFQKPLKSMHHRSFDASAPRNGCPAGGTRRRSLQGRIGPARFRMSPIVEAAGHFVFGSSS